MKVCFHLIIDLKMGNIICKVNLFILFSFGFYFLLKDRECSVMGSLVDTCGVARGTAVAS